MNKRESFSSRWGFICACIGSAVGMGNIWMFPTRVSLYGGGSFLIPYFIFVILIGSTGVIGEMSFGRAAKAGPIDAFGIACEKKGKRKVGEALLQIDFVTELFTLAKEKGVNTCLDTAGNPFTREKPFYSKFEKLMEVTDLFMLDIKEMDEDEHKQLTGQTNKNILDMATCLSDHGKAMWIRHVLVPGITDDDGQLHRLRAFIDTLKTVERVEILPYHTLGVFKWKELGIPYALEDVEPPTKEQVEHAREIIIPGYKS